jgi:uncharacterized protein YndB with AHSA1/START domain
MPTVDESHPISRHTLRIVKLLDAPPELVFEAWSSAEHARHWWYPRENGEDFVCTSFRMDFRVGGAYRYCIRSPKGVDTWAHGVFREIVTAKRLAFTFKWEWSPQPSPDTIITITFDEEGASKTRLIFCQEPFDSKDMRDAHSIGWAHVLDRLAEHIAKKESGS